MADDGKKKGVLGGGNLLPKVLILFAVGIFVSAVLFGLPVDLGSAFWFIIRILVGIAILVFAIKIMEKIILPSKQFSPTESFRNKLIKIAEMSKPPRTNELYMRGEDMRLFYKLGKITGLAFIPYWAGQPVVDKQTGKFVYVHKHDKSGKPMYDTDGKAVMIHEQENITEKDGDWLFVITKGMFPALSKKTLVRAHKDLCSDIGEKVFIKCTNVCPVGDYSYPNQQWQASILRINLQHQAEAIIESHHHFLDLVATVTESSLRSDPMFVKMLNMNTENISSKESTPIQSLGRQG